jgi:hypothetical protein
LRIVQICCTQHVLNKYEKWYHTPKQKPLFLIRALEKIKIEMFIDGAPSDAIAARRLTDYLEKALVPETI